MMIEHIIYLCTHILQCSQYALCLAAILLVCKNAFYNRLTWMHGSIKLMVHVSPEP